MSAVVLYARLTPGHAQRVAEAVTLLREAAARHPGRIVFTTSLGAEDMVLADLIARNRLPIALATLQTGRLHAETLALIPQLELRYGLNVEIWEPQPEAALQFTTRHGTLPMRQSIELRKACCALRKLEPLSRALQGRTAWVTGLRREQSDARAELPLSSLDEHGREKLNPLAAWSQADVWQHIRSHAVPYNPLHDQFFPSVGCAPCTRAVAVGEDIRAGRWWWEQQDAKECGLHVSSATNPTINPAIKLASSKETA
jgi:phosphoadenosine phosphosulfate reductase